MINWIKATNDNIKKYFIDCIPLEEIKKDIYKYEDLYFYEKSLYGGCVKRNINFYDDSPFIRRYVFLSPNAVLSHNQHNSYLKIRGVYDDQNDELKELKIIDCYALDVEIQAFVERDHYENSLQKLSNIFLGNQIEDIRFVVQNHNLGE